MILLPESNNVWIKTTMKAWCLVPLLFCTAVVSASEIRNAYPNLSAPTPVCPGDRAIVLSNGMAAAPENAPAYVKYGIWAVNTIVGKPYKWGGGHGSSKDCGYDCSGSVSFLLHYTEHQKACLTSGSFLNFGESGKGRWLTVYAKNGHVYATVAGLRLDTTSDSGQDQGPRWRMTTRSSSGFTPRHPAGY